MDQPKASTAPLPVWSMAPLVILSSSRLMCFLSLLVSGGAVRADCEMALLPSPLLNTVRSKWDTLLSTISSQPCAWGPAVSSHPWTSKQLTVHDDMGGRLALWYHIYGSLWTAKNIQTNNLISENILSFHQFNQPPMSSWTVTYSDVYVSPFPHWGIYLLSLSHCTDFTNSKLPLAKKIRDDD